MIKLLESLLDLLFPNVCGVCGKLSTDSLCTKCKNNIKDLEISKKEIKIRIEEDYTLFYIFLYEGIIREKIIDFKFKDKVYLAKLFAKIINDNKKACRFLESYDIIIPVPSYKIKKWKRGYNQVEQVVKELAKINKNIKYDFYILKKIKNTKAQSSLNKQERKKNLNNAYKVYNKDKILNKKVLIVDDIYTTGSTVKSCIKEIRDAGAKEIGVFVIAKD